MAWGVVPALLLLGLVDFSHSDPALGKSAMSLTQNSWAAQKLEHKSSPMRSPGGELVHTVTPSPMG